MSQRLQGPQRLIAALSLAAILGAVAVIGAAGGAAEPNAPTSESEMPAALRESLASHGIAISDASESERAAAKITAEQAAELARAEEVPAGTEADLAVYFGSFTNTIAEQMPADLAKDHPAAIDAEAKRPVYVVQIRGLEMPAMGGFPGSDADEITLSNHELEVLIDARTGEEVLTLTFR